MTTVNQASHQRSPFSIFPNEQLCLVSPPAARPRWTQSLSDLDKLILLTVNEALLTTCQLLYTNLCNQGLENVDVDTLRHHLKHLTDVGFLTKMEFRSLSGTSLFKVYTMSESGRDFLRSAGQKPRLTGYIAQLDAVQVKKLLAAQQFVLSQNYEKRGGTVYPARTVCQAVRPTDTADSNIFRTQALVDLPDQTILVEAVRNSQSCSTALLDKLRRINSTLAMPNLNTDIKANVTMVIVCESHDHMLSVMREVRDRERRLSFRVRFTNDPAIHNNDENRLWRNKQEEQPHSLFSALLRSLFQ